MPKYPFNNHDYDTPYERRWAIVFDQLRRVYTPHPQDYAIYIPASGFTRKYVPDGRLEAIPPRTKNAVGAADSFVECKKNATQAFRDYPESTKKAALLAIQYKRKVILTLGDPIYHWRGNQTIEEGGVRCYYPDGGHDDDYYLSVCPCGYADFASLGDLNCPVCGEFTEGANTDIRIKAALEFSQTLNNPNHHPGWRK